MRTEIESPAFAANEYTRAKLFARWGAAQSHVVSESVRGTLKPIGTAKHGCTMNSTGTRPGLPDAFSAETTTVSRYTPVGSPAGLNASRSFAGAVPFVAPTNASHDPPSASRALQESVPGPALTTARLSPSTPTLPTGAESRTSAGATESLATGGGVLVSLSTWQVASSIRRGTRMTARGTPHPGVRALRNPRIFQVRPTTSPQCREDDTWSKACTGYTARSWLTSHDRV